MRAETIPPLKTVYRALEEATLDLYGFAVVCNGGASWAAEPGLYDSLFLGLENFWFIEDLNGQLTHREFREEFFRTVWEKSRESTNVLKSSPLKLGTDVPLGHEEMPFYQLPQLARAALYLRVKKNFAFSSVALILGTPEPTIRTEVERAREFLLGRRVRNLDWGGEDF
jgi:hypothetical protein